MFEVHHCAIGADPEDVDGVAHVLHPHALHLGATEPEQHPFVVGQVRADGQEKNLTKRIGAKLASSDIAHSYVAARVVRLDVEEFLRARWTRGFIGFTELWAYYTRYPYLHRLRDKSVLIRALEESLFDVAFLDTGFALATGFDSITGDFLGLAVPLEETEFGPFDDKTLVVRPDLAVAQRRREHDERVEPPVTSETPGPDPTLPPVMPPGPAPRKVVANATFSLKHVVDPSRNMSDDLQAIAEEILALGRMMDLDQFRGAMFAEEVIVVETAPTWDRVVAYAGRSPF